MISLVSLFFAALIFSLLYSVFTKKDEVVALCGPGLTDCDGVCVDTTIDNANCNGCGNVCRENSTCIYYPEVGFSSCVCDEPTTLCGNVCANLLSQDYLCCDGVVTFVYQNNDHCGSCEPCTDGQLCTGTGGYSCETPP